MIQKIVDISQIYINLSIVSLLSANKNYAFQTISRQQPRSDELQSNAEYPHFDNCKELPDIVDRNGIPL